MSNDIYEYSVEDHDEYSRFDFPTGQVLYSDWELVATDLASDFFHNHDGWEWRNWPYEFRIYKDGKEVARLSVDMETEPRFYAHACCAEQTEASDE